VLSAPSGAELRDIEPRFDCVRSAISEQVQSKLPLCLSITVNNIRFDRTIQFAYEDNVYLQQQIMKNRLISFLLDFLIFGIFLVFSLKYFRKKYIKHNGT